MRPGPALRGVRAIVFAGICVVLALLGHVHLSGEPVPAPTALAALGLVTGLAWWLGGRRRGPIAVAAAATGAQAGLHLLFSAGQAAATTPAGPASPATSAVERLARTLLCGDLTGQPLTPERAADIVAAAGLSVPGHHHDHAATGQLATPHADHAAAGLDSWGMLAAHLAVALLSGLWLARGERATFTLLGLVGDWLAEPLRLVFFPGDSDARPVAPPRRPVDRTLTLHARLLLHTVISRGPPAAPAVV